MMGARGERPEVVTTVAALREVLDGVRAEGKRIGLVPTMGVLHEGHLSLVRACAEECDYTVVSIYVNPSQFAPSEDLDSYPRTLDADLEALAEHRVGLVFAPSSEEVYPSGFSTWVEVGSVAKPLEGVCRPDHFRGVATVVLKLFGMVGPDTAFFGQKDFQQALVIRRMVEDLDVRVAIRVCPTVREPDGLAMSSRNAYLKPGERQRALVLWKSLSLVEEMVAGGERDAAAIVERMREQILSTEEAKIEYVALVDPDTLEPVSEIRGRTLAALAVQIGGTRLIDNLVVGGEW